MAEDKTKLSQSEREAEPGFEDEVAARRAQAATNGHGNGDAVHPPAPQGEGDGQTLEDRTNGAAQTTTEEDGQTAFVWEHGQKVPLSGLVKRGTPIEYRVKFGGVSVKGKGTPVPLDAKDLLLVGRYHSGGLNFVPTHDDEGKVEKVTVYATLKPQGPPVDVASPEGELVLGPPKLERAIIALLDDGVSADYIRGEVEKVLTVR